jgi:predicted protein tyrosine phosphatase
MNIIRVHSHEGAATLHPRRYGTDKAAMVRMTTMPEFVPLVFQDAYVEVLELRFADVTAEGWKYIEENDQDLIDRMLEQGHAMWPMSEGHATSIIEFVDRLSNQIDLLVVHCDAGVSRSSAVAMSICEKYGLVDELRVLQTNPRFKPNLYVRDLLRKHYMPSDEEREGLYAKLFFPESRDD